MYGLDPDAMIASGILDGTRDAPIRQAEVAYAQNGGVGHNGDVASSMSVLEADQNASGARKKTAAQAADTAQTAAANNKIPSQSPFESKIVDDEAELPAGTAEGWDLVRDLPGERFLIRRKIPRS